MPFFTVILSRILVGDRYSWRVYISLLPIIIGVSIATVSEVSFDIMGLGSALMATAGFSVMNIFSKKVLKETGVHHLRLLCTLGRIACFMFLPVWLIFDCKNVIADLSSDNTLSSNVLFLLFIDGVLHWMQNILAFTIIKMVAPLTYAVANVTKRISIISVSLLLLQNHVTSSNVCGMMMAIGGVFYYNKVKYDENKIKTTLPTSSHKVPQKPQNPLLWNSNATNSVRFVSPIRRSDYTNLPTSYHNTGSNVNTFNGHNGYTNYNSYNQGNSYSNHSTVLSSSTMNSKKNDINTPSYLAYPTRSPSS